jgi:hypothetical protein
LTIIKERLQAGKKGGDPDMKGSVKHAALAGGIVWGVALFLTTLIAVWTGGYAMSFLQVVASIYPGYSISYVGSLIGLIYGFLDVFIGVYIVVWVYNLLRKSN